MGFRPKNTLLSIIQGLGLTSGLKVCLDAGDASSYTSGQKWLDTSGNGYDFFLGTTGSPAANDPTFNGTPGNLSPSEFWSFDGGDFFRYDATNETWMQNIHKNNAKYTFVAWLYAITGSNNLIMGNNGNTAGNGVGFHFGTPSTNNVTMRAANGVGSQALNKNSVATVTNAAWNFIAASVDEATGTGYFQCNGIQETFDSTYLTPSSANASFTTEIGARGNGNSPMPNGSRIAMIGVWEGVTLTQAQINDIYKGIIVAKGDISGSGVASGVGSSRASAIGAITGAGVALGRGSAVSSAIGAITGAGIALGIGTPVIYGAGTAAGIGTATGVLRATSAATAFAAGIGTATGVGTMVHNSVGNAYGQGQVYGISYAFFFDPEVVCIRNEPRVAYVQGIAVEDLSASVGIENRDAFAPMENRVANVPWERRDNDSTARSQSADTLNRQRKC